MKNMFGRQPGRAALRYEKRAKEEAAIKKKEAAEAVKKSLLLTTCQLQNGYSPGNVKAMYEVLGG